MRTLNPFKRRAERIKLQSNVLKLRQQYMSSFLMHYQVNAHNLRSPNLQQALQFPAFLAAVRLLSQELAMLPIECYQLDTDGEGRLNYNGIEARILRHQWTESETAYSAMQRFALNLFTEGVAYAYIQRPNGSIRGLKGIHVLSPDDVTRNITDEGVMYTVTGIGPVDRSDMMEVFWFPSGSMYPVGEGAKKTGGSYYNPVNLGWNVIKGGLLTLSFASDFFGSSSIPAAIVTNEDAESSQESLLREQADLESAIHTMHSKGQRFIVARSGTKVQALGIDPEQAQLVDSIRIHVEEIARLFGIPAMALQELSRGTYSNVEQADLHLKEHTIAPWARIISQELTARVFGLQSKRYVELNTSSGDAGTLKDRTDAFTKLTGSGVMSQNEARRKFSLPDIEGGDSFFLMPGTQINDVAEDLAEQSEPDPEPAEEISEEENEEPDETEADEENLDD